VGDLTISYDSTGTGYEINLSYDMFASTNNAITNRPFLYARDEAECGKVICEIRNAAALGATDCPTSLSGDGSQA
jgi:hypothetical protein